MSSNFARTLLVAIQYLSGTHEKFTDSSGKYWGNAGAGILFIAEDTGRFLLQHRSMKVNEPGTFSNIGGKIDDNEDPKTAALREAREETGYDGPADLEEVFVFKDGSFRYHNFVAYVPHEFDPQGGHDAWEAQGYVWASLDDLPSPLHFGMKALLPYLKAHLP